jgi:hypothetical protein
MTQDPQIMGVLGPEGGEGANNYLQYMLLFHIFIISCKISSIQCVPQKSTLYRKYPIVIRVLFFGTHCIYTLSIYVINTKEAEKVNNS